LLREPEEEFQARLFGDIDETGGGSETLALDPLVQTLPIIPDLCDEGLQIGHFWDREQIALVRPAFVLDIDGSGHEDRRDQGPEVEQQVLLDQSLKHHPFGVFVLRADEDGARRDGVRDWPSLPLLPAGLAQLRPELGRDGSVLLFGPAFVLFPRLGLGPQHRPQHILPELEPGTLLTTLPLRVVTMWA